ncbi:MAG: hypothetical protein AAF790_01255, partial [Planctomycetota bacterium]
RGGAFTLSLGPAAPPGPPADHSSGPAGGVTLTSTAGSQAGAMQARLQLRGVEASALTPWTRRFDPSLELAGRLDGQGVATWRPPMTHVGTNASPKTPTAVATAGRIATQGLSVASNHLGGDPVAVGAVEVPWRIASTPSGGARVEELGLGSGFATAAVRGEVSATQLNTLLAGDWAALAALQPTVSLQPAGSLQPAAAQPPVSLEAEVDLARLGRLAPQLLHLRQGVQLESGRLRVQAAATPEAAGQRVTASVATADLIANAGGRPVRWQAPLQVQLSAVRSADGVAIERLACQSAFLNGAVTGDMNDLRGAIDLDLDRLVADAQQVFDFGRWRLSGRADGDFRLRREAAGRFTAAAGANVTGCVVTLGDLPVVQERRLKIALTATGRADPRTQRRGALAMAGLGAAELDAAELDIDAAGDRLTARLTEPTPLAADDYPLDIRLVGDLAAWLRRVNLLAARADASAEGVGQTGLTASGQIDARLAGRFGTQRVSLATTDITATGLTVGASLLQIDEPRVQFTGDLAWDAASGGLASRAGKLVSSTLAAQADGLVVRGGVGAGKLGVRADLARLSAAAPGLFGNTRLAGMLVGGVDLVSQADGPAAQLNLVAQPFSVIDATPPAAGAAAGGAVLWQEPTLRVRGGIAHAVAADRLTLTGLSIESNNLSATANGRVEQLSTSPATAIAAAVAYDLAELTPVVAQWLGPGVQLVGRHQAEVQLASVSPTTQQGSAASGSARLGSTQRSGAASGAGARHWSRAWSGRVTAPWTGGSLYGLAIGPGRLDATLGGGMVQLEPIAVAVGQGRLTAQPAARLDPAPAEWGLPAGTLIEGVRISPEVSDQLLKFIAPLLADATRSEGTFTLRTEGVRARLDNPAGVEATGQLAIRGLRVTPGPGVADWVATARQVEALAKNLDPAALASRPAPTLLSIAERTVNFRVAGGRVYHEGLTFDVDGAEVTSSGSVGFDETVRLTLSVPLRGGRIETDRRLAGLRGQAVQFPIGGTLTRPRVDRRALEQLNRQLLQQGLQGAIQSEIGRALDKLFD